MPYWIGIWSAAELYITASASCTELWCSSSWAWLCVSVQTGPKSCTTLLWQLGNLSFSVFFMRMNNTAWLVITSVSCFTLLGFNVKLVAVSTSQVFMQLMAAGRDSRSKGSFADCGEVGCVTQVHEPPHLTPRKDTEPTQKDFRSQTVLLSPVPSMDRSTILCRSWKSLLCISSLFSHRSTQLKKMCAYKKGHN